MVIGIRNPEANLTGEPLDAVDNGVPCFDRGRLDRTEPSAGIPENDDVAAIDVDDVGDELVHDDAVVDLQGVLHRSGRDIERADQEGFGQKRDDQGGDQDDEQVPEDATPPWCAGVGATRRRSAPGGAGPTTRALVVCQFLP